MNTEDIYNGDRGERFVSSIISILKKGHLKQKYIDVLTEADSLKMYDQAFTSASANPEVNYEFFEQLGDVSANKFIVWYMYKRFPKLLCPLGVKVVARLRINYGDRQTFYEIGDKLGFWDYITATHEERNHKKKDLIEDCVESFIGVTEYLLDTKIRHGVGYAIIYDILQTIFDDINISLAYETLYDAKTRLKELFDFYSKSRDESGGVLNFYKASWVFVDHRNEHLNTSYLYFVPEGIPKTLNKGHIHAGWVLIGQGTASLKKDSQQVAAQEALGYLKTLNYEKPVPPEYKRFDENH